MKTAAALPLLKQIPRWVRIVLFAIVVLLFFVLVVVLPLPIPAYLDFQVLYQTNVALLHGISPYDHAAQVQLIAGLAHVSPAQVYVLPFPYPPWYALGTAWLVLLPIQAAARLWLGISVALLLLSAWLLTDGWSPRSRLLSFVVAILFLPVLGSLFVGQYGFPVLLGAALMTYALRHESAVLAALAAALLTFKPHLGALILLAACVCLWLRRDAFGRRALLYILAAGTVLFCMGFLADHNWPLNYVRSLLAFQNDSGVSTCVLCASLPVFIASRLAAQSTLSLALPIGASILLVLGFLWIALRRATLGYPAQWMAASVLIVLLASPYLLNYDFILLLVPLFLLASGRPSPIRWLLLSAAYLLPFVALGILGRQGNFIYPLSAFILLILLVRDTRQLDGSLTASYNHSTIEYGQQRRSR